MWPEYHYFRENSEKKKVVCNPCSNDSKEVQATHFCKTCEDPEPLCEMCAKQHTRHKLSKDHKICADIEEYPDVRRNIRYIHISLLCFSCMLDRTVINLYLLSMLRNALIREKKHYNFNVFFGELWPWLHYKFRLQ